MLQSSTTTFHKAHIPSQCNREEGKLLHGFSPQVDTQNVLLTTVLVCRVLKMLQIELRRCYSESINPSMHQSIVFIHWSSASLYSLSPGYANPVAAKFKIPKNSPSPQIKSKFLALFRVLLWDVMGDMCGQKLLNFQHQRGGWISAKLHIIPLVGGRCVFVFSVFLVAGSKERNNQHWNTKLCLCFFVFFLWGTKALNFSIVPLWDQGILSFPWLLMALKWKIQPMPKGVSFARQIM